MALIPAILEFSGIAKDACLSLTLTTAGAAWSIGADALQTSEGFSYNGLALGEARQSCLASIELTDSVLAIRTASNATATSFSLTVFIEVQSDVESVQGYCTLNAGAAVVCRLGYDVSTEWRSGPFSAIVRAMPKDVRRIRFNLQRAPVGMPIAIELMTEQSEGAARWCFDSGLPDMPGLAVRATTGGLLPLQTLTITDRQIVVTPGGGQRTASDISIDAYLRRTPYVSQMGTTGDSDPKTLTRFHLRVACDPGAAVIAQVGAQRPQYLTAAYSCLYF